QETTQQNERFVTAGGRLFRDGGQRARFHDLAALRDHVVDDAVVLRLLGRQVPVAVRVALDALERLAGVLGPQLVQLAAEAAALLRSDLDVRRRSTAPLW